ncbi:hypothetical protein E2R68_01485 [Psychromonas sp. RZ22]|uniref:type II secretion system protein GspM n=1 Tax=Psychromonas algarum TaxID=2555643 RepID=UPI001067C927|nr:type II secretion system protein GspM [Psychromonas sp. RZ22]TEW56741.1 hypothetical protein E2R68_01485 [Psychromonas sp. RZ22]
MRSFDIKALDNQFKQLTQRERVSCFAALLICTLAVIYFWMLDPAAIATTKAEKQLQSTYTQQSAVDNEIGQVKLRLQDDPIKRTDQEIVALQQTLTSLNGQLSERLGKFIAADKMAEALSRVLAKTPGIKINYLTSLPVQLFDTDPDAADKDKSAPFYKHSLELQLTGNYSAVYQYLYNLESLQDEFFWYSLKYEVTKYPLASITLQVYTLSNQQDLVSG